MNLRANSRKRTEVGVQLSPLIDCVFLLLIFFLVTSMIKRFERQIPVTLSDDTSAITKEPFEDSFPIGVSEEGLIYAQRERTWSGMMVFERQVEPEAWLREVLADRGPERPVTVLVERGTPFQRVIDVQDQLELTGFRNVRFRVRDFPLEQAGEGTRSEG